MALRLTGVSLAKLGETGQEPDFEALIGRAVELIEGRVEVGADPDELRDRLLRGYRYILVDEYQDIDRRQYARKGRKLIRSGRGPRGVGNGALRSHVRVIPFDRALRAGPWPRRHERRRASRSNQLSRW